MLAVRPSPATLWPIEHRRGRSRQISHAALARLAAQRPPSPSPDYYDSPPSPPRSLEDQVHVAYAHDDIHLAKILLLRLKGIHVTGNDDPRIAEVKDEDFDFCFVPHGRLLDDEDEKALKERQRAESERVVELRRAQRLKDCERIWEQGKKQLRELKTLAIRRRDLEEKRRTEANVQHRRASRPAPTRTVVSYKLASPSPGREQELFVYDFMPQPTAVHVSRPQTPSQPKSKSPFTRPLFDDSRAVPFSEVLTSMKGPLFPPEQRPTSRLSNSRSKKRHDSELLEFLLMAVESETKGKARERPVPRRKDSGGSNFSPCPTCSSSSSLSSDSSRRSWLSFSSTSSVSTAVTTPSSSPPSSPSPLPKSWFLAPQTHSPSSAVPRPCKRCTHRTPVSPAEAPLPVLPESPIPAKSSMTPPTPTDDTATTPASGFLLRRFTQFIDLAKGFQHAYMSAAMFAVPAPAPAPDTHATASLRAYVSSSKPRRFRTLYPSGARVRPADVRVFLCPPSPSSPSDNELRPIPLRQLSLDDDDDDELELPRTELPDPLPYELRFKPHPVPPRSPFRAVHGAASPGNVVWRLRNVENPVYLRVKALENDTRGLPVGYGGFGSTYGFGMGVGFGAGGWAIARRPVPGEGTLACGREKVLKIAYEGIGTSRLRFVIGEGDGEEVGPVLEGRGRRRRRLVEHVGEGDGDGEIWIRGGRRTTWW